MKAKHLKIGVIGLGSIGWRHATNLIEMEHEVYGMDPDFPKVEKLGRALMGKEREMDAFIISSPTSQHNNDYVKLASYKKPIFIEKPIGATQDDYDWFMADKVANQFVGYNLRFHSCVKKAKEWLNHSEIGKPLWANFTLGQYSEKPPYLRDGVILNWSHEIDLALYLLGPADVAASSTRLTDGKDDITDILLTHKNGCRTSVHLDYLTKPEIRQGLIVGNEATIIFDLVHRQAWLRDTQGEIIDQFYGDDDWNDNYIEEMEAFLDRAEGKETLGCTGEEALKVLEICLKVRKAAGLK